LIRSSWNLEEKGVIEKIERGAFQLTNPVFKRCLPSFKLENAERLKCAGD
jgi:hypothetical protein